MRNCKSRLAFTSHVQQAYRNCEVIFICVGTPERGDGYANLKYVYEAAGQIAENADSDCVVVVKSTVPIGTNDKLEKFLSASVKKGIRIQVASNPCPRERLCGICCMVSGS
jgi:UDPglucose 6-dehydrogenase